MRLAVFSDLHGNLTAFDAAWADYQAVSGDGGADALWFLGDLAAFGARPAKCVARVRGLVDAAKAAAESGTPHPAVRVIRGNTDRYLVRGGRTHAPAGDADALAALPGKLRDWTANWLWGLEKLTYADYEFLAKLPGECDLAVPGFGHVIGYHGTPGDDEGYLLADTPDEAAADALLDREGWLGIGGHIHRQFDRVLSTGWRVINVGSVGMSYDRPGFAQWGWFTFDSDSADRDPVTVDLRAVPYDVDAAIADLRSVGYPGVEAAAQRLRNGEPS